MPAKTVLVGSISIASRANLDGLIGALLLRDNITFSQGKAIIEEVSKHIPCTLSIEQRMPKGTTYVRAGARAFTINQRAKLLP